MLLLISLLQNTTNLVRCCDLWDKIKTISLRNHRYLALTTYISPTFHIFVVKLKLLRKLSNFLLLYVTLTLYLCSDLGKAKYFIVSKMRKLQNQKMLLNDQMCPQWSMFGHFLNSNFVLIPSKKEIRAPSDVKLVHIECI